MKRERDVLDYAALGLSAAQAYKLTEIASEMGKLRQAADDEKRKARRLGQVRQMVLMTEELLDRLESDTNFTETSLQRQFALAYEIEASLKLAGVLPPRELESWEDQERVRRVERRIGTFRDKLVKVMPYAQRREAELCLKYMDEEPDLGQLIMVRSERESFLEQKQRLQEVEAELKTQIKASPGTKMTRGMARIGLYLLGISIVGFMMVFLVPEQLIHSIGVEVAMGLMAIMLVGGCGLYLGQFFLRALTFEAIVPQEIKKLEAERTELKEAVGESADNEESPFERMAALAGDKIDEEALAKKFGGDKSVEKLRAMYAERREFVRRIIGPQYLAHQDSDESVAEEA